MRKIEVLLFDNTVGYLYVDKDVFSFEYDNKWLETNSIFDFDPNIYPYKGRQYPENDIFGFIKDSLPDRFGRLLLDEEEKRKASEENRLPRKLTELDYLLKINDLTRVGAFQFKDEKGNLCSLEDDAVPPYIYLRDIESASIDFEKNGSFDKETYRRLLLPGSSLGGARPKANIYFNDELWIAKFPSINDGYDLEAWEKIATDLARLCEIEVCDTKLEKYSELGSTLLIKRFDRDGGKRIHYSSFLNMLSVEDGENSNYSYLDLVGFVRATFGSAQLVEDSLLELYKRTVFNYLINNTDNHLRNNGLLYKNGMWTLSPMFDINPTFFTSSFALNATQDGYSKDIIIDSARYYLIDKETAEEIYKKFYNTIKNNLRSINQKYKVRQKEIEILDNILDSRK